ncbi:vomeronasal type-1 receptor 2 [Echinops telfairi]|uniref:Vomeronasal type-1 receptor n=1 Tax=Echinops telfairi TaxID=9371 RepID=A0ABM0J665_ECHTE|nr:vomeronasal type-1 receptor 2 [Echinops telfairi]
MDTYGIIIAMIQVFQIVIGVIGNFSLIIHYICLYFHGFKSQSTDLTLRDLTVANSLVILSKGVPQTIAAFGWKDFLNDRECQVVLYIHRVARGVSIGSTCLLSVFQAITINPRNSRWAYSKIKAQNYIGLSNKLLWVLQVLVNASFPIYMTVKNSNKTITKKNNFGLCSVPCNDNNTFTLFIVLISSYDILCIVIMSWASGFMLSILYRHKQQVRHIYSNNLSHRSSPETRASQSILLLVSTFVFFYGFSSIIYVYLALVENYSSWLVDLSKLITACFPTISPFILMSSNAHVMKLCCVCCARNVQFPPLV